MKTYSTAPALGGWLHYRFVLTGLRKNFRNLTEMLYSRAQDRRLKPQDISVSLLECIASVKILARFLKIVARDVGTEFPYTGHGTQQHAGVISSGQPPQGIEIILPEYSGYYDL